MPERLSATGSQVILLMGVAGSGKTTLARRLSAALGARLIEADDYHPAANLNKMRAGVALDDADREPWLASLAQALSVAARERRPVVCACSALKHSYRDRLRRAIPVPLLLIYLSADRDLLYARLRERPDHFMPASLLDSQLATLEPPDPSENAVLLDAARPVEELLTLAQRAVAERAGGAVDHSQATAPGRG